MEEENGNLWFRKVGFYNNPFSIKPAPFDFKVIGQDELVEELVYKIPAGTITFLEGPLGSGKSTVMKHLIHKFRGKGQVIFFSCNRIENELNIEDMLMNKYGFWGRLVKKHPKNMILLLDEAQELTPQNTERIKYFFDQGNIKSVVFAGIDYDTVKLHQSIRERIGQDGVLRIKELSDDEAVTLVRNRIGNMNVLSDEMIKKLFKSAAGKNPRRLLQRCDKACKHVIDIGLREFNDGHFKELFGNEKEESIVKKKMVPKKKPVKIMRKTEKGEEDSDENLYTEEEEANY